MYKDCYLRFSSQKYTLKSFHQSIHQTSYAVQRKGKNFSGRHCEFPKCNTWNLRAYKNYLRRNAKESVWNKIIYPGMKQAIVGIMLSSQSMLPFPHHFSKGRFGLYGCDFILDKEFRPWLMEIKSCPDLNPTTKAASKFCKSLIRDVFKGK